MKEYALLLLFLVALGICAPVATAQRIVYVNHAASGANDGGSWEDAFVTLQDALSAAEPGDGIWVAAGTYKPDQGAGVTPGDRSASFVLKDSLSIYGGFLGNETSRGQREWKKNETILSGDLMGNDNNIIDQTEPSRSDNSIHVVSGENLFGPIVLDGFTITGGNAVEGEGNGAGLSIVQLYEDAEGNVLQTDYTFSNLTIVKNAANAGGGASLSSLYLGRIPPFEEFVFRGVIFEENIGSFVGGGLYSQFASLTLDKVDFFNNRAGVGGGIFVQGAALLYWRSGIVSGNQADGRGGAMEFAGEYVESGQPPLDTEFVGTNLFFAGNISGGSSGAISLCETLMRLTNSVFTGNTASGHGGAIGNDASQAYTINTTFYANRAGTTGGAINTRNGEATPSLSIKNSIFWGNTSLEGGNDIYSRRNEGVVANNILQDSLEDGYSDEGGNLFVSPLFEDPMGEDGIPGTPDDNLRLTTGSPAIDSGGNQHVPSDTLDINENGDFLEVIPADLSGNARIYSASMSPIVDIGAYEYGAPDIPISTEDNDPLLHTGNPTIIVFPNPLSNRGMLRIEGLSSLVNEAVEVALYDALGRQLSTVSSHTQKGGHLDIPLRFEQLPEGAYIVRASSKNWVSSYVVFKVR